jgi:hypothetical protein
MSDGKQTPPAVTARLALLADRRSASRLAPPYHGGTGSSSSAIAAVGANEHLKAAKHGSEVSEAVSSWAGTAQQVSVAPRGV